MKILFTLFSVFLFALTTVPQLSAQHNKNFSNFIKVQMKMNYAGEATDIVINDKAVVESEKFNNIKKALAEAGAIGWLQEFFWQTEFKIYFFCSEPNAPSFRVFEVTDMLEKHITHLAYRETFAATKTTPDYTAQMDALYEAVEAVK